MVIIGLILLCLSLGLIIPGWFATISWSILAGLMALALIAQPVVFRNKAKTRWSETLIDRRIGNRNRIDLVVTHQGIIHTYTPSFREWEEAFEVEEEVAVVELEGELLVVEWNEEPLNWEAIIKWEETDHMWLMYIDPKIPYIAPKRMLLDGAPEAAKEFRAFLMRRIGEPRMPKKYL